MHRHTIALIITWCIFENISCIYIAFTCIRVSPLSAISTLSTRRMPIKYLYIYFSVLLDIFMDQNNKIKMKTKKCERKNKTNRTNQTVKRGIATECRISIRMLVYLVRLQSGGSIYNVPYRAYNKYLYSCSATLMILPCAHTHTT